MDAILYSSSSVEWGTPQAFFDALNDEFRFTLDAAASDENAKCERYYTKEVNGLTQPWNGVVWLNPPYGKPERPCKSKCKKKGCRKRGHCVSNYQPGIEDWMDKAANESEERGSTVVCLVPARTDTWWFDRYVWGRASELRFVIGRLAFTGGGDDGATFPSVVIVYRSGDSDCRVSTIDRVGKPLWK